ncbi:hypothetical protein AAG570_001739, partial [Ranatra chinensis]
SVSIVCWLTIIVLIVLRCHEFCTYQETTESIFVDTSRGPKLRINLDLVFPQISCSYLSLDAMDSSGEQHLHIDHNIFKRRLDLNGNPIEEPKKESFRIDTIYLVVLQKQNESEETQNSTAVGALNKCGSCYGAENESMNITCCNTCEEVREAYRLRRWHFQEMDVEQCKSSATAKQVENAFKEGCQIYGYMEVNRVAGSFHVAPGQSFSINHVHVPMSSVHDVQPFSSSSFNTSHYIRHLSFGNNKLHGNVKINPLDGMHSTAKEGATMFNYYIKIVPTLFVNAEGATLHTNQFSVTKHEKVITPMSGESGMPGVFFSYELSAMMVKITDKVMPLSHLITDICSVIGGVWIVSMFIDSLLYKSSKILQKIELGKAS